MTNVRTFTTNFRSHDEAVEWGRLNGWTLQTTERRENGGVRAFFMG